MNEILKKEIELLPDKPGCYQMRDIDDNIIYIGKAKNLKKRVSQYFYRPQNGKTFAMVSNVDHFTTIVTNTEKEALILEMNMIKKYLPRYNILLMDDKHYPYIGIYKHIKDPYVGILRNTNNKKISYYGPFPSSNSCYEMLDLINKLFKLRKCKSLGNKPCIYYSMNQCFAPCINKIDEETYKNEIKKVDEFLKGNNKEIVNSLKEKIKDYSSSLDFENAKECKDILDSILNINEKQKMEFLDKIDRDFIAFSIKNGYVSIVFLVYRNGKLTLKRNFVYEIIDDVEDFVSDIIYQYYQINSLPKEIVVSNVDLYENMLSYFSETKIILAKQGLLLDTIQIALENAKEALDEHFLTNNYDEDNIKNLELLGKILNIKTPFYIELFDNSHLQGTNAIGAMVVFKNGINVKKMYRKYNIQNENKADDLKSMEEVLLRRYSRIKEENQPLPDLILLDGGKTQLEVGLKVLKKLDLNTNIASLFKDNNHRTKGLLTNDFNEVDVSFDKSLFFMLTRMQDEVHRYAISTHIQKRNKDMFKSIFDDIPQLGEKRIEKIKKIYPTISDLKNVTLEELCQIIPKNSAIILLEKIKNSNI